MQNIAQLDRLLYDLSSIIPNTMTPPELIRLLNVAMAGAAYFKKNAETYNIAIENYEGETTLSASDELLNGILPFEGNFNVILTGQKSDEEFFSNKRFCFHKSTLSLNDLVQCTDKLDIIITLDYGFAPPFNDMKHNGYEAIKTKKIITLMASSDSYLRIKNLFNLAKHSIKEKGEALTTPCSLIPYTLDNKHANTNITALCFDNYKKHAEFLPNEVKARQLINMQLFDDIWNVCGVTTSIGSRELLLLQPTLGIDINTEEFVTFYPKTSTLTTPLRYCHETRDALKQLKSRPYPDASNTPLVTLDNLLLTAQIHQNQKTSIQECHEEIAAFLQPEKHPDLTKIELVAQELPFATHFPGNMAADAFIKHMKTPVNITSGSNKLEQDELLAQDNLGRCLFALRLAQISTTKQGEAILAITLQNYEAKIKDILTARYGDGSTPLSISQKFNNQIAIDLIKETINNA